MDNAKAEQTVRSMRLIVAAMMVGVIGFGAVAAAVAGTGEAERDHRLGNLLLLALAALVVVELPAYAIIRGVVTGNLRRTWGGRSLDDVSAEALAGGFATLTLIGAAMAEGVSLFGLVVVLVSGRWVAFAAPAAGLFVLALLYPARDRFRRFVGDVTGQYWA